MATDKGIPRDIILVRELAQRWGMSEWALSEWIRTGYFTVKVKWLKGKRYVRLRDADKWFDEQPEVATGVYKGKVKDIMMRKLEPDAFEDEEPAQPEHSRPKRVRLDD
jgi:hypothetical protein